MKELTLPEQRIVEIARAMVGNAKILIMDEPTAALTSKSQKHYLKHLKNKKGGGRNYLYISLFG